MDDFLTPEQILFLKKNSGAPGIFDYSPGLSILVNLVSRADSLLNKCHHTPEPQKNTNPVPHHPVLVIAGGTDLINSESLSRYRNLLTEAVANYHGTIISGGTTAGISGIVGYLQDRYPESILTIGYLPTTLPETSHIDPRYKVIRKTAGGFFSPREPLQYWTDILASGISPAGVKLIGISGGNISAAEYRIALLLGAKVGIFKESGRAAADLLEDPEWNASDNLVVLTEDGAALRAFMDT
jgi:hypothetical protein